MKRRAQTWSRAGPEVPAPPSFPMLSVTLGRPLSENITIVSGWNLFLSEAGPLCVVKAALQLAALLPQPPVIKACAIVPDLVWSLRRQRPHPHTSLLQGTVRI